MYGWGRTPVFPTEGSAWPISSDLLSSIYRAGYQPALGRSSSAATAPTACCS